MKSVKILAFLSCIASMVSCSKNSHQPDNEIRVTEFPSYGAQYTVLYNDQGKPSVIKTKAFASGPYSLLQSGTTEFHTSGGQITGFTFTGELIGGGPSVKSTTTFVWKSGRLHQSVPDNPEATPTYWKTDITGRIIGSASNANDLQTGNDWRYDAKGDLYYTNNGNNSTEFTYAGKQNPFAYGGSGQLLYITLQGLLAEPALMLSAHLPEKIISRKTGSVNFGGSSNNTFEERIAKEYSYEYDAAGLLISYTLTTNAESFTNGTLASKSYSQNKFPVKCVRL